MRLLERDGVVESVERGEFAREKAREVAESARVSLYDLGEVYAEIFVRLIAGHEGVPFSLDFDPRFCNLVSKARTEIGVAWDVESVAQHGRDVAVTFANAPVFKPLEIA